MDKAVRNAMVIISILLLATFLSGCTGYEPSTEEKSIKDGIVAHVNRPDPIVQDSDTSVYVNIKGGEFIPETSIVKPNTKVIWTNWHLNSPDHTVTSNDNLFDSGTLTVGDTFSYVFKEPGVYNYRCTYHSYMKGTVVVEE